MQGGNLRWLLEPSTSSEDASDETPESGGHSAPKPKPKARSDEVSRAAMGNSLGRRSRDVESASSGKRRGVMKTRSTKRRGVTPEQDTASHGPSNTLRLDRTSSGFDVDSLRNSLLSFVDLISDCVSDLEEIKGVNLGRRAFDVDFLQSLEAFQASSVALLRRIRDKRRDQIEADTQIQFT
jgi:hypothetical protein